MSPSCTPLEIVPAVKSAPLSNPIKKYWLERVFTTMFNVAEAVEGYGKLEKLADSLQHIVPGHDPLVMQRYPAVSKALEGIAVQLDADPTY